MRSQTRRALRPRHDPTAAERAKRLRAKRKAKHWQSFELWLSPDSAALLTELKQPRESLSKVVDRALRNLRTQDDQLLFLNPVKRRAAIMARLLEMSASGLSNQQIADQLNGARIPTLSGEGQWDRKTIQRLLKQAEEET
jgi:DNA-binding NarL/FixJ family response regulator